MDEIQHEITQVIDGKLYSTNTATLLASNYRTGSGAHLYKSPKGQYFIGHSTIWEGQRDRIELLTKEQAKAEYEAFSDQKSSYEEAFGEKPEEG